MIFDTENPPVGDESTMIDPMDFTRRKKLDNSGNFIDLLVPIFQKGELVY